ncbi:MAG: PRC-barrel domain-containing protein [Hyphomicrobium denitrificans]|uniref:PRC-barrel domain protein n=1 Tax=Hyphomicrobium denitrificans (strain ATCC 51888 / DSM 1869 / NCIMB 11706 / TK 0415) TaxID=582899 RepID=D8JVK3_HYPDA|nr:PRC-barrel domain-containing protein [Hyphomicrobium denitrificans]ADJ22892.1 PRC-barrel domain protein [Hyphomicrobium denitrificans ATCC 51888]MBN9292278.1 PRC-barrel domain-containing protein [Hyphomicrobium denitrificans]
MNFKALLTAAAIPAFATVAYAQTTTPAPSTAPSATTTTTPSVRATGDAMAPQWYSTQQGEWRTSKLIGSKVQNKAGESIGDINEIILASDGSAAAAVIGVGGFLGMGEHQVAVQFKSLKIGRDTNGNSVITLDTTKDALKSAPSWSKTNT